MFINVPNPSLDAGLDELVAAQPARTSKAALAEAILERAVAAYRDTHDPLGWMALGPSNTTQADSPSTKP